MHLGDLNSQYSSFLPSEALPSPSSDTAMAICCPSPLASPHAFAPTPTAASATNIFQFPPPIVKEEWQQQMQQQQQQQHPAPSTMPPSAIMQDLSSPNLCGPNSYSSLPSPMAISPSLSTLNTPRGSITDSIRHSPMNTDQVPAGPLASAIVGADSGSSNAAASAPSPAFAATNHHTTNETPECFDSYFVTSYPSPPGSRYSSPTHGQSSSSSSHPQHDPPTYEEHQQQQQLTFQTFSSSSADPFPLAPDLSFFALATKQELDYTDAASPSLVQGKTRVG